MSDVQRVIITKGFWKEDSFLGTHALMTWSQHINREMLLTKALDENKRMSAEIERLRKALVTVANVGSGEAKRLALEALRELEESDERVLGRAETSSETNLP